jgi:hypothetical protein
VVSSIGNKIKEALDEKDSRKTTKKSRLLRFILRLF